MPVDDLNRFWRWLSGPFREFGPATGLFYAVDRVLRRLSPRLGLGFYELVRQPVPSQPLLQAARSQNLRAESLGPDHPALESLPVPRSVIESRFLQGAECIAVSRDAVMLGYIWFGYGRYEEDEVRCTYLLGSPATSVFDFDLYLFPQHRMGTGFISVWHCANEYLRSRGVDATFSRITRFNLASRRAHARLGAQCIGRMWFLKLGSVEIILATLAPYISLTRTGGQRPVLRLG